MLALGVEKSFAARPWDGPLTLSMTWGGNSSLPGHTLRRGPEGPRAREGRHLAGSVNHGANMRLMAVAQGRQRCVREAFQHTLFVSMICWRRRDRELGPRGRPRSRCSPQAGLPRSSPGSTASMTPASTSVLRSSARPSRRAAVTTEWASMWEDELLERIASTSATNIEAGLRDRVRELRDRGMSWARIGIALGMRRQSA